MNTSYDLLQKRLRTLLVKEHEQEATVAEIVPNEGIQALATLIEELRAIDINSPLASLNETSITDNNGGRIQLNEDLDNPNNIKK